MKKTIKDLLSAVDHLPHIAKIILCIPALDIVWALYRIAKGYLKKDVLGIVIGILWIVGACTFTWVFDLVTTILYGKPKLLEF